MPRRKKSSLQNHSRSSMAINKEKPQQRYAANARERARMRVLSRAFCRLKTTLPWVPADTKLSKLDTLRLAASYIAHLKGILRDETLGTTESSLHPAMSMTWPFGFNRPLGGSTGGGSQAGGSIEGSEDDMDDVDDGDDNDDGESISSCTWEEASPPPPPPLSSSAKECIHLDTSTSGGRRVGGARGKGNSNNSVQVRGKEISSPPSYTTTFYLNKQSNEVASSNLSPTSHNNNNQEHLTNKNTQNTIIRPLSQIQQHYHHQHHSHFPNSEGGNAMFPHAQLHLDNKLSMAVTNLENIAVPISQNDGGGMGMDNNNSSMIGNDSFGGTDMNMNGGNFTSQEIHHHHQQHHHLSHLEGNNDEMQNVGQGAVYGYNSGDLMSIG